MAIYSEFSHEKVIFHSFFVCLPEGISGINPTLNRCFIKNVAKYGGTSLSGKSVDEPVGWSIATGFPTENHNGIRVICRNLGMISPTMWPPPVMFVGLDSPQ